MKIIQFAIKGTEDYSKAQDKEMEDFGKIENLLTDTISNIESGNTPTKPSEPEEPVNNPFTESDIGKYVNYVPVGTDYTAEAKYSGHSENQVFNQDTSLKWRIWKVENEKLYLISDKSPIVSGYDNIGNLLLGGVQGYNNGVTLLDNICQNNYGININENIKVNNLKIEDILSLQYSTPPSAPKNYGTQSGPYKSFPFPSIWHNNERDSLEIAENNRSIAYPLVDTSNSTVFSSSETPYYTMWHTNNLSVSSGLKNQEQLNMISSIAKTYWLSSRYVCPLSSTICWFGLQFVIPGGNSSWGTYSYSSGSIVSGKYNCGIRPLVQIPLKNCEITEGTTNGIDFEITIK